MSAVPTIEVYDQDDNFLPVVTVRVKPGGVIEVTVEVESDVAATDLGRVGR